MPSELRVDNINSTTSPYDPVFSTTGGALSHRNMIINGAMQVAQRSSSPVTVANASNEGFSTLDRWYLNFNASLGGSATFSQDSDAPTGFNNSLKIQCASDATPSSSTTQYLSLQYIIEAQDLQQLGYGSSGAKTATLSFYAKRNLQGNDWGKLSVQFTKYDNTVEYSLPTATTLTTSWARYTIPVPANTTTAIDDDNGQGLRIGFVLAGNSSGTYASTADTSWGSTRKDYASDVGNLLSDTSNIFYLTGVQLELGSVATPFEHRSYGDELQRCQRYFQRVEGSGTNVRTPCRKVDAASSNAVTSSHVHLPIFNGVMRAEPILTGDSITIRAESGSSYGSVTDMVSTDHKKSLVSLTFSSVDMSGVTQMRTNYINIDAEL